MCARENLLKKAVKKIGRPRELYFPGESSKPVIPEPVVRNSQNSTHHEDTHQSSTHHREGRQSSRETKTTDSLNEQPTVFEDLHIAKGKTSQTKVETLRFTLFLDLRSFELLNTALLCSNIQKRNAIC